MVLKAREILKQLYNCCDLIGEMAFGSGNSGRDLRELLLADTALFAARVSVNGTITDAEAAFLNALIGKENAAETWQALVAGKEKSDVPEIFLYFARADQNIMRRRKNFSREASMTESLYRFYGAVGEALIAEKLCTEEVIQAETERLAAYLKTTDA